MPTSPFAADASTQRLLADGYQLTVVGNHLIVEGVPYVTEKKAVAYGRLALPVVISGDQVQDGSGDHRIWFVGELPHDAAGQPLPGPSAEAHAIAPGLVADFMISSKPRGNGAFDNMYEKFASYVRVLSHPAQELDALVSAQRGGGLTELPDDLPFVYPDTATSRAGLAEMNSVFRGQRIGIIGLGGTGGYILDQVAKTWVDAVHLFDGDTFDNHNAFRAPGAASLEDLNNRTTKAAYFAALYGRMHTNIIAHSEHVTASNLDALGDCTFVFMAAADAPEKAAILEGLRVRGIPVIEVGMGIRDEGGKLSGLLAVTTHRVGDDGIPRSLTGGQPGEYDRNIQVADLNSLNAMMAVIAWKKHLGYYADASPARESIYKVFTGDIRSELDEDGATS